jgi:signal transduction histidine kinase
MIPLGIRAGAESPLAVRLAWLTGLRLAVVTVFLIVTTTVYAGGFPPGGFSSKVAFATIAVAYGLAAVYAALLRIGRALEAVALVQLVTDQIVWTAAAYISGGATSGAASLYILTSMSGAILLGMRGAFVAALWGFCSFALLCAGFVSGLIQPPADQPPGSYATKWADVAYPLFVDLFAIFVVTLLAGYLAERLRATGGRLVQVTAVAEEATARAEEAERLALLGRIAAGLAHEIRNPLGAISGSIELLRTGGTLEPEDVRLCELIERETARLNDLVGDMLSLSKPRAPTKQRVDLCATGREVVALAGRSGRGGDVLVRFEGPEHVEVLADAAQMRQVVWNLVRNAVLASSAGEEVVVRVTRQSEGRVWLEIADRGPGIAPAARERLFDAFFTTRSQGAGIGLAVVKRIVDDHGFAVEVDCVEGRGTTFRVIVPHELGSAAPGAEPEDDAESPGEPRAQGSAI